MYVKSQWAPSRTLTGFFIFLFFFPFLLLFGIEFYYLALAGLELTVEIKVAATLQRSACLCLPSAGLKCVHHLTRPHTALVTVFEAAPAFLKLMWLQGACIVHSEDASGPRHSKGQALEPGGAFDCWMKEICVWCGA